MSPNKVRVLCVDDRDALAQALMMRINLEPDLQCDGYLTTADELIEEVGRRDVDAVVLDIEMPGIDPFRAVSELRRTSPDVRVVILSAYVKDEYLDAAVESGAWGYLSKYDPPEEVVEAVRKIVVGGEFVFGSSVRQQLRLSAPRERVWPATGETT